MRNKNLFKFLLGLMAIWLLTTSVYAELRTSISHYGITWTFDGQYECGQFVTDDWWVVGPVTLISVSPAPTSTRNGSCVNPTTTQGYDYREGSHCAFSTKDRVSYPFTLQPNQSLVSSISKPDGVEYQNVGPLQTQAVLTAVSAPQPAGTFRPSYCGTFKRYFNESQINYTYLPNLPKPASAPSTGNSLINYTDMPKIDHITNWSMQFGCAEDNFANGVGHPCYGRDYNEMLGDALLYTMLNTPERNELVNNLIQIGIDNYGVIQAGDGYGGDGGHMSGRKAPIVFAAKLLNDPEMLQVGGYPAKPKGQDGWFAENDQTFYGVSKALFGIESFGNFCPGSTGGAKDQRDPNGLLDACGYITNNSPRWVGPMLSMLMIDAKSIWNYNAYFDYVDRWMNGDVTYGDYASSAFAEEMWDLYRDNLPAVGDTIDVTGISVSPTSLNIDIGTGSSITKTISPSNATNQSVTWSSSNTAIATVDASGSVLGVGLGTCSVTATTADGGFTASCNVEVSPVGTNPSNISINKPVTVSSYQDDGGGTFPGSNLVDDDESDASRWSASGFPQWAEIDLENIYDLTSIELYTYQSRDYQYIVEASLDGSNYTTIVDRSANTQGSGLVDAVSATARYVKITVSGANAYTGTWSSLNELKVIGILSDVTPTPVTAVSVSPTSLNIAQGLTSDLTETVSPANATNKSVTWSTSNASIATVSASGLVTAVGVGTATITVTTNDGGFTDNCSVTVTAVPVTGVSVLPTSLSLQQGLTSDLTETVLPANATDKTVVWSSDNTSIATVNSSGLVTAVAEGAATITVTTNDGSYTATCDVTVTYTPPPVGGYYCDPISGNISNDGSQASPWPSLQAVIAAGNTFADGEFIYLMNGNHGTPVITEDNTADVTITRAPGHNPVIQRIAFVGASHWVLDNVDVSSGGIQVPTNPPLEHPVYPILANTLVEISGSCSYITLDNCYIYSVDNSSAWTADDWNYKAWSGVSHKESDHVTIRNCHIKNVNFGLDNNGTISNTIYEYNTVENYNGDGARAHGANMVFQYNTVKNSYTTNGNHGDMLQTVGTTYGVIIRNNKFLVRTDPNQPFQGACQGIGLFDGMYYDFVIENNLVVADHWNGITLLGAVNCKIVNNTLVDINNVDPGPAYIQVAAHKDGTPSSGNLVRNNLCTDLSNDAGIGVVDNNIEITWFQYDTYFNDFANSDYSLKAGCNAIDAGSSDQAPAIDIDGVARPQGSGFDVGAYEFSGTLVDETNITVLPESLGIDAGSTGNLSYTLEPVNATTGVNWSSSNPSVATVNGSGVVLALSPGTATITATTTNLGLTDDCVVTVTEPSVPYNVAFAKSITVTSEDPPTPGTNLVDGDVSDASRWSAETFPQWAEIDLQADYDLSSIELYTYQSRDYQYIVEAKPDGGSYTTIVDRSSNTQGSGLVDAVSTTARYVKITVSGANTYAGTWSSLNELKVIGLSTSGSSVPVTGVTLSSTNITLDEGQTSDLDETVAPANATDKSVSWSTSNALIATVDANGLVTAVSAGNATITVTTTDGGFTATCDVAVNVSVVPVTGVSLSASTLTLDEGQTSDLDETVSPANATDPSVIWSTSNGSIATVDANGLVTAVSAGNATITVTTNDGGYTATCNVTVQISQDPIVANIVGYWSMDELNGGITLDNSGNGIDGTVTGAVQSTGQINGALNFDGSNDKVSLGNLDVSPSSGNDGITLAAWINPDSWYGSHYDNRIISKATGTGEQDHYWMLSGIKSGDIAVLRFRLKTGSTTSTLIANLSGEIVLNQWTHVAATYDGGNMKVYVNGNEVGSVGKTGTVATSNSVEATIGLNPDGARPFDGDIDEVYILDRALSGTEINDLMTREQGSGSIPVTEVSLSASTLTLDEGQASDLDETVSPANATDKSVIWSTSNASVATVNSSGLVTAVSAGNAVITVTTNDGGFTATCDVTVNVSVIPVTGVSLSASTLSLDEGQTSDLDETVSPANATDKSVSWSTSNASIATVDANGLVTALSAGNATITVTTIDGGYTATCDVTVNVPVIPVTGVSLSASSLTLNEGQTSDLDETVSPANATDKSVIWSTSNALIATVDANGLVTALSAGNATITVTTIDGGYTATCDVTVNVSVIPVTGVSLSASTLSLDEGQTSDLDEIVAPANATDKSVSWSTSNASIATVDANGLVTAVLAGNATITVTTTDGGFTATCDVTVNTPSASEWVILTYDDFESGFGNYTPGGSDCYIYTEGSHAHQGSNAITIVDDSGDGSAFWHTNAIDVTSYTDVKVKFWFKSYSMETGESFEIQYFDGSSWVTVASRVSGTDFTNNAFYTDSVILSSTSEIFTNQFKLRFECISSSNGDYVYLDEIEVSAFDDPFKNSVVEISSSSSENASVRVYPNPVSGNTLNIQLNGYDTYEPININIVDLMGRLIYAQQYFNQTEIQVTMNEFNKGVYILSVNGSKQKIMVE